jgi:hypothetical protein
VVLKTLLHHKAALKLSLYKAYSLEVEIKIAVAGATIKKKNIITLYFKHV